MIWHYTNKNDMTWPQYCSHAVIVTALNRINAGVIFQGPTRCIKSNILMEQSFDPTEVFFRLCPDNKHWQVMQILFDLAVTCIILAQVEIYLEAKYIYLHYIKSMEGEGKQYTTKLIILICIAHPQTPLYWVDLDNLMQSIKLFWQRVYFYDVYNIPFCLQCHRGVNNSMFYCWYPVKHHLKLWPRSNKHIG